MAFEAELRAYLERVERGEAVAPIDADRRIDEHRLRAHFLKRLRELEEVRSSAAINSIFRRWSPRIPVLARYVEWLPQAPGERQPAVQGLAERLVDVALETVSDELPQVEHLELRRITDELDIEAYAFETGLVRKTANARQVTQLGRIFLTLRGRDAVRWLLTVELMQSTGSGDSWRVSRELLETAASKRGISKVVGGEDPLFLFDRSLLERLLDAGVLYGVVDDRADVISYRAAEDWLDVIHAAVVPGPWHRMIAAILEDARASVVPTSGVATEAVVEQAKMIAHEVRNALIPVRHHLDALRSGPGAHGDRLDAAKRGVVRVLTFVEEMVAASELIAEVATPCDLPAVVHEARGWVDGLQRIALAALADVRVLAPRSQLTRVVSNVLRNALQATQEAHQIRVGVVRVSGLARVVVDDAGRGVPKAERDRVFQQGYTTRSDGSGYGLAYVRRVVTDELRGRVWCEDSDLGGARFVIELPSFEPER